MSEHIEMTRMGRRGFLAGTAATAFTILKPELVQGAAANSKIELGLIGCGGRGGWIADLFAKHGGYKFVACADYYQDRVDALGEKFGIDPSRRHAGLSGYKKLLEGKLDAVVIETPPYFHPQQAADAVEAGKHVYIAKPIAVDVPGCLSIGESGKKATAKKLVFLVDFQTRANEFYREAAEQVHDGIIGKIVCGEARYPWAGGVMPAPKDKQDRLRLWYCEKALSGDYIVEQNIHTLDVATWFLNADPVKAVGACASKGLRNYGNIKDCYSVTFWFPDNVLLNFMSVQCVPGVPDSIHCRIYGKDGVADTDYYSHVWIKGKKPYEGGQFRNLFLDGAVINIKEFHQFVTEGNYSNPTVAPSVRSNLTCVLGRIAGEKGGQVVTWDEMIKANEKLEFDLSGFKS